MKLLGGKSVETLTQAYEMLIEDKDIGYFFADQSPKFVEIFSVLHAGIGKTEESVIYFNIINNLFELLTQKAENYFGALHYLADSIIRRFIPDLYALMSGKHGKLAFQILIQSAQVHHTHCRELFSSLDFSNHIFRTQSHRDSECRQEYVKLATVFVENPEVSSSFLSSKYFLASIWKDLKDDEPETIRNFVSSMIKAVANLNQSTRRWVFSDATLKNLAHYPFDSDAKVDDPRHMVYELLRSIMEGPNSILYENPARTYCISIPDIDPSPRNLHILQFIRDLEPWKRPGHRKMVLFIFRQSPDLISHYFTRVERKITPELNLAQASSLLFIDQMVSLPWPGFLESQLNFFGEKRSLDLLFESILPSILTNEEISMYLKHTSVILRKSMIVILIKAIQKFKSLPSFLKTPAAFTKLNSRIPQIESSFVVSCSDSPLLLPFLLKLLNELNDVIPFYLVDNPSKIPDLTKSFTTFSPIVQFLLLKIAPLITKPLTQIPLFCSIIKNNDAHILFRKEAFKQLSRILESSGVFDGYEKEIPLWISHAIGTESVANLNNLLNQVSSKMHLYIKPGPYSPAFHGLGEKMAQLKTLVPILNMLYQQSDSTQIDISPLSIMNNLKWYSLAISCLMLCTSIQQGNGDLSYSLDCLKIIVCFDPDLTLPFIMNHPFFQSNVFAGNDSIDYFFAQMLHLGGRFNENYIASFINNTVNKEIIQLVSSYIGSDYRLALIGKMIQNGISVRSMIQKESIEYSLDQYDAFWKWAFEGFVPIDVDFLATLENFELAHLEQDLVLDVLRTIYIFERKDLLSLVQFQNYDDTKIHVFLSQLVPEYQDSLPDSIPIYYLLQRNLSDPVDSFVESNYNWSFDFLLQCISKTQYYKSVTRMKRDKLPIIFNYYMRNPDKNLYLTFEKVLKSYVKKHPEMVKVTPTKPIELYSSISSEINNPSYLSTLRPDQFEGVVNILAGSSGYLNMRTILFLSTELPNSQAFCTLLESQGISPSSFLFATGEVAKFVIKQIESNQKIFPANLCRNVAYLQPFHLSHQKVEIDTPQFRYLLHFAYHLLETSAIPINVFLECGAVSILFRSLSSKDEHTRSVGYSALSELYDLNTKKEWQYQNQISLFLEILINSVVTPNMRFPSIITYFLTVMSHILIKPTHNLYLKVIKYIGASQALRINAIPLFNDLFKNTSIQHRTERNWILKTIKNGLTEPDDVVLMKNSKVIERLLHIYSSPLSEMNTRKSILEIILQAAKLSRLDGIVCWVVSVISEQFSIPHVQSLVEIAKSIKNPSNSEQLLLQSIDQVAQTTRQKTE